METDPRWTDFEAWCSASRERSEPPEWTTIVHYVRDLAASGERLERIRDRLAGLAETYLARGLDDPTGHGRVRLELEAIADQQPTPRKALSGSKTPAPRAKHGPPMVRSTALARPGSLVEQLAQVPAEETWLADLTPRTRRAYRCDVRDFIAALRITSPQDLYAVTPAAVIHWRAGLEASSAKPSTIVRKLSALSSLFQHLVEQHLTDFNPVKQVARPRRNRARGTTATFSREEARALLDSPPADTLRGLRDRAILSVGFQAGLRRAEIANLHVSALVQHQGLPCLRFTKKGGTEHLVPLNPQTKKRIEDYLAAAGHGDDHEGALFRPLRGNQHVPEEETARQMEPDMIDKILRRWTAKRLGHTRGFSAHSMRATFITRALENGCPLERVQKDVGHAHPSTTQLYDHRGDNAEEAATFFANY